MGWWVAGTVLALLTAWATWDVGRPGRASGAALGLMRAVGGLGLLILAAHALNTGARTAALVAALAATPLIAGLFRGVRATATTQAEATRAPEHIAPQGAPGRPEQEQERRAA